MSSAKIRTQAKTSAVANAATTGIKTASTPATISSTPQTDRETCRRRDAFPNSAALCGSLSTAHLSLSGLWTYIRRWDTTFDVVTAHIA